ncbi:MAG: hypothetical protein ACYC7D_12290 [Nitrososphaerales archaeon]
MKTRTLHHQGTPSCTGRGKRKGGKPGGIQFRIIYDYNSTQVIGAIVHATNKPALCNGSLATAQISINLTTNGTEWYSLLSDNNGGYSFLVTYSGKDYTFDANLQPVSMTCATLFVPSGHTNVTITEFGSSCETQTTSTSSTGSIPANCPAVQTYNYGFQVTPGTTSPAVVCVQLYYYSGNSITLNLSDALSIQALQYIMNGSEGIPKYFSGAPNFTVATSQSQLVLGGINNKNEGAIVSFSILANNGASGTYELSFFGSNSPNTVQGYAWMLAPSEPLRCGYYG